MNSAPELKNRNDGWPVKVFGRWAIHSQRWLAGPGALLAGLLVAVLGLAGCSERSPEVIVYTSQDHQFAEPILAEFTKQTGVKVRAVYDSEAVKTVALANRLLAEAKHPRCDVWWSNEALRTWQLVGRGVLESNSVVEFGFRSRRIVVNTNKLSLSAAPRSLLELTNAEWRGKVALAYPMFGTTSAQFMALRRLWGEPQWEQWCRNLAANAPFLVDGNSVVVRLVGRGEAVVGLTDFDDIVAGRRESLPVDALPANSETLLIPNSVALVRGAPHPAAAQKLRDFLRSEAVVNRLIQASALEGEAPESRAHLRGQWETMSDDVERVAEKMRAIFLR